MDSGGIGLAPCAALSLNDTPVANDNVKLYMMHEHADCIYGRPYTTARSLLAFQGPQPQKWSQLHRSTCGA